MSDKLDRPPIEPMSDVTWARVERRLWSRMDNAATTPVSIKRPKLWLAALPVAAIAALAAVVIFTRNGSTVAPADQGSAVSEPTRIVAGDAPTNMSFADAHVELEAHSALVMQAGAAPSAVLESGTASFTVPPRGDRAPFIVLAGDTRVRVIGTQFRVARDGESSQVTVEHGIVEVTYRGSVVRVSAHQTWASSHPQIVSDIVAAAATPTEPEEIVFEPDPLNPAHKVRVKKVHAKQPPHDIDADDADRARYEALVKLEAAQPDTAMKGYLELSKGSGRWAAVALYAAGRLAVDRHDPRAETLLAIYLRRFPEGANAADANQLLTRLRK